MKEFFLLNVLGREHLNFWGQFLLAASAIFLEKLGSRRYEGLSSYYADKNFITKKEVILAPRQWLIFCKKVSGFRTNNAMSIYTNMMGNRNDDVRGIYWSFRDYDVA